MENNTIHPDEMDRLLRETFLESDFPETDSITDLMAKQAFTPSWPAVPPVGKEAAFVAKKGFFAGFSLNTFLIGGALLACVSMGAYLLMQHTDSGSDKQASAALPLNEVGSPAIPVREPVTTVAEKPVAKQSPRPTPPPVVEPVPPVEQTADTKQTTRQTPRTALPPPEYRRYVLIPDISAAEAVANEKRKQDLVRQTLRQDKKEWAYIPTGTTTINGQPVSVHAFYMMAHEVSNIQYKTFLYDLVINERLREYEKAAVHDSGWIRYPGLESFAQRYFWNPAYNDYPVVNVSLEGANMYCEWLTRETNKAMAEKGQPLMNDIRLPMTEEWIYAAKADHDSAEYAWNGPYLRNARGSVLANYHGNATPQENDGAEITAPVTAYPPNDWGLYNLCGNVGEMTLSVKNGQVTVKGGSWSQPAEYLRIGHQNRVPVNKLPLANTGFRAVYTFLQAP